MAKNGERPLNVDIPKALADRFRDLQERDGRRKKELVAAAIYWLTTQDAHERTDAIERYKDWLADPRGSPLPESGRHGRGQYKRRTSSGG